MDGTKFFLMLRIQPRGRLAQVTTTAIIKSEVFSLNVTVNFSLPRGALQEFAIMQTWLQGWQWFGSLLFRGKPTMSEEEPVWFRTIQASVSRLAGYCE